MRIKSIALAGAALFAVAACSESAPAETNVPGGPAPAQETGALEGIFEAEDRTALAFGLPDQVAGMALARSPDDVIDRDEDGFAFSSRVRPVLVEQGLSPERVMVEHKSSMPASADTQIPALALAAVQTRGVPAQRFAEWDPTFYMLLTSVDSDQYKWLGEKPGAERVVVGEHTIWMADFERFKVAWYPKGQVLYVVLASNDQLLEMALAAMPQPGNTAPA